MTTKKLNKDVEHLARWTNEVLQERDGHPSVRRESYGGDWRTWNKWRKVLRSPQACAALADKLDAMHEDDVTSMYEEMGLR